MQFGEKLYQLRKEKGISQEKLAEALGVSRQAVSKWESRTAYPELEKLILMSELFGVTLDYLIKEDEIEMPQSDNGSEIFLQSEDAKKYVTFKKKFAAKISLSIAAFIMGLLFPILMDKNENDSIGGIIFLFIVAIGVFVLIVTGISNSKYAKFEGKEIRLSLQSREELTPIWESFKTKLAMAIAFSIFLIIIAMAGAALINYIIGEDGENIAGASFMACVSIAVGVMIYSGIMHSTYEFLLENAEFLSKKKKDEESNKIFSIIMPLAVMIYLILGFIGGWWHPGWVVFPIAVLLGTGISKFMK